MSQIRIVAVHDLHLPIVDSLKACVDERPSQKIEIKLCFRPAHVRYRRTWSPLVDTPAVRIKHVGIAEIPLFYRPAQREKGPVGHGNLFYLRGDDLEDAGFKKHLRISLDGHTNLLFCLFEIAQQSGLSAP